MKTTDWKFDFPSLPRWDVRERIPYVYDEYFEIPQSDTLCCIYSIAEVSMCNYLGFLAILKNKEKPELILNETGFSFGNHLSVSVDGRFLVLQPQISYLLTNERKSPILMIDVCANAFSYFATDHYNPCYQVVEIRKGTFGIEADHYQRKNDKRLRALSRKKIRVSRLKWHSLSELHLLPEMLR